MVYPIMLPNPDPNITFQIWDKDLFSPNDFISEATFSFQNESIEAFEDDTIAKVYSSSKKKVEVKKKTGEGSKETGKEEVKVQAKKDEKFTITLLNAEKPGFISQKKVGNLTLSLELIPMSM